MSLEISSDDVLDLVENIEEWFLLDKSGLRSRVNRLRERIRALEAENAQLRAALTRSHEPSDAPAHARREPSTDPWAIPGEPTAAPTHSARFACQRCGELHDEGSLQRVDGALVCASCNEHTADPPVKGGSYR